RHAARRVAAGSMTPGRRPDRPRGPSRSVSIRSDVIVRFTARVRNHVTDPLRLTLAGRTRRLCRSDAKAGQWRSLIVGTVLELAPGVADIRAVNVRSRRVSRPARQRMPGG